MVPIPECSKPVLGLISDRQYSFSRIAISEIKFLTTREKWPNETAGFTLLNDRSSRIQTALQLHYLPPQHANTQT
jgi:hypothetical protein